MSKKEASLMYNVIKKYRPENIGELVGYIGLLWNDQETRELAYAMSHACSVRLGEKAGRASALQDYENQLELAYNECYTDKKASYPFSVVEASFDKAVQQRIEFCRTSLVAISRIDALGNLLNSTVYVLEQAHSRLHPRCDKEPCQLTKDISDTYTANNYL